jgi:hypothetical protein
VELTLSPELQTLRAPAHASPTRDAERNLRANQEALRLTQPDLLTPRERLAWRSARDGSLTVRDSSGWWAGCSLPARAAVQQLKSLEARGPLSCFLDPPHAAHLSVALDKMQPSQAIVALIPHERSLAVILGSENLSQYIADHRLWFVAGAQWAAAMRELFRQRPGLATPTQFIRLNQADPQRLDPLIDQAREAIASVSSERTQHARELAAQWQPRAGRRRCCIVTGRSFHLWNESGRVLADIAAVGGADAQPVCSDDPISASTHELLRAATQCDALLTADIARADLPDLLPAALPWISWVTSPRIPVAAAAGPNDRLLLADPAWESQARAAGWKKSAIEIAGWPLLPPPPVRRGRAGEGACAANAELNDHFPPFSIQHSSFSLSPEPPPQPSPGVPEEGACFVALVADTIPLDAPQRLEEFSSHRLLWNSIRDELCDDPWAAGNDADMFLAARQRRYGVPEEGLDRGLFLRGLIEPAAMQGMVRRLLADGAPIRVFGRGWSDLPAFAAIAGGAVDSREQLAAMAASAAAILDTRSSPYRDQRHALGRPVIRCSGRTPLAVRQEIATAISGKLACPAPLPAMELSRVQNLIRGEG